MSWIAFVFIANIFFSLTNIFDKFFNAKKIKHVYSFAILLNLISLIFILITTYFLRNTFSFGWPVFYAGLAGLFWFFMWIIFWKAMQTGEASRVSAIFFSQPIFSAVIGVFFLHESLNFLKWTGIALIVIGAFLSSWDKTTKKSGVNKAYYFALLASIISAIGNSLSKYAMNWLPSLTVNSIAFYLTIPLYFFLLLNKNVYKEVKENLADARTMSMFFIRALIGYGGICFFMLAVGKGPISLVSALSGTQPLFVLFFSVITSLFLPKIIKEETHKQAILSKIISILLVVVGAALISF